MHLQTGEAGLRLSGATDISTWDAIVRSRERKHGMHSSAAQCILLGCQSEDKGHSRSGALLLPSCCPITTDQYEIQDSDLRARGVLLSY